jgi:hypothetical protein
LKVGQAIPPALSFYAGGGFTSGFTDPRWQVVHENRQGAKSFRMSRTIASILRAVSFAGLSSFSQAPTT